MADSPKPEKKKNTLKKFPLFFEKKLSPHFGMTADHAVK